MNADTAGNHKLARAAASLAEGDYRFLKSHGMLPEKNVAGKKPGAPEEDGFQEDDTEKGDSGKGKKVEHRWPEIGTVLEADYQGLHYEAKVISMPRYKSGKAIEIISGPADGEVERSMSGAMLKATKKQREENDLGRKGVANGWDFWRVKE